MTRPVLDDDRALGMDRAITRRDFMEGVAVAVGGAPVAAVAKGPAAADFAGQPLAAAAPLHALRDGAPRPPMPVFEAGGETADLVVVGAGISGLGAAFLYRQHAAKGARVLVLDALAEPGGHAVRNEFVARNGRRLIGYGGSEAMDSPSLWSPASHRLIRDIGIDLKRFETWYDQGWEKRHGLDRHASWFDAAIWGESRLVRSAPGMPDDEWAALLPMSPRARTDLVALLADKHDPWPALDRARKRQRLAALTYDRFLVDVLRLDPQVTLLMRNRIQGWFGVGTDATSALDAYAAGMPGFKAMKLGAAADALMSPTGRHQCVTPDEYIYHFPDGNAGVVRCLLRALNPGLFPDARSGIEALVLARRDDAALDVRGAPVRLRLNSPVLQVRHAGDAKTAAAVDVTYADASGALHTVRAAHVVLACFHRVIPFLCPELPAPQVSALNDQVKVPLIYGTVLLSHWRPFKKAGIARFRLPGQMWEQVTLDMPVSIGSYRFNDSPDDPILLHLPATVLDGPPGRPEREQCAAGRRKLQAMRFSDAERDIRRTLNGALGAFGFDAANDIEAITLNRWAHGYAYEYMRPWDAYWPDGPLPIRGARRGWGRIAIANADAGAYAYAHGAIDQATRAVAELLPGARLPEAWDTPGPSPARLRR